MRGRVVSTLPAISCRCVAVVCFYFKEVRLRYLRRPYSDDPYSRMVEGEPENDAHLITVLPVAGLLERDVKKGWYRKGSR